MAEDLVYFDWNIIGYYRDYKFKGCRKYSEQMEFLEKLLGNKIVTFFTESHINDLIPLGKAEVQIYPDDFKALTFITSNYFLNYDILGNNFNFEIRDPEAMFKHNLKYIKREPKSFDEISELGVFGNLFTKAMQSVPSPIPPNSTYKPEQNNSFLDVMEFFMRENSKVMEDPKYFKERKNMFFDMGDSKDFQRVHTAIQKKDYSEFEEILKSLISSAGGLVKSKIQLMQLTFGLLDQCRIGSDKAQKNLQLDSNHAGYASVANCKFLVSMDAKLLEKAKIAYDIFDFPTLPVTLDEFIAYYKKL